MSLAKLTSISTQTLSLLLERQRLQTNPSFSSVSNTDSSSLHIPQITRNLSQLRAGVLELEAKDGRSEAVVLLRGQYERMRGMIGPSEDIPSLDPPQSKEVASPSGSYSQSLAGLPPTPPNKDSEPVYTPYTDDVEAGYHDPGIMLQTQRQLMEDQDQHLDRLHSSINRQHNISLQINDELDAHTGLLEELDTDLDRTESRLTSARRRLDRVARGAKENGSTVTIAVLIFVLLILIISFKT